MSLTKEKKIEIFTEFGGTAANTGSVESQVALITHRINHISNHLKTNRKDFSSTRSLYKLVGQRKKLLKYLANKDINQYRTLIEKLNLRK
ncbi:MAG: 30S ribosomal protein S15 [Chitinophagales bacterium]|nr:30S ribosomal protein S15 [Chitinophagales bacterium]